MRHYNRIARNNSSSLPALSLDNARSVVEAYQKGPLAASNSTIASFDYAKEAFQSWFDDLSHGLANLVTFYNPSCVVLGGGMSKVEELLQELPLIGRECLRAEVDKLTLPATRGACTIFTSSLGDDAAAFGAALLI